MEKLRPRYTAEEDNDPGKSTRSNSEESPDAPVESQDGSTGNSIESSVPLDYHLLQLY